MRRRAHHWSSRIGHDVGADHARRRAGARGQYPAEFITAVSRSVMAVRRCHAGNAKQIVASLLSALHSAAAGEPAPAEPVTASAEVAAVEPVGAAFVPAALEPVVAEPVVTQPVAAEPTDTATIEELIQSSAHPERDDTDPVVAVESPFGFNARLGTAVAAAAIIVVLTVLSLRHRSPAPNIGASLASNDPRAQAAGDVSPTAKSTATKPGTPRPTAALPPAQFDKWTGQPRVPVTLRCRPAHVSHRRDRAKRSRHERGVRKARSVRCDESRVPPLATLIPRPSSSSGDCNESGRTIAIWCVAKSEQARCTRASDRRVSRRRQPIARASF